MQRPGPTLHSDLRTRPRAVVGVTRSRGRRVGVSPRPGRRSDAVRVEAECDTPTGAARTRHSPTVRERLWRPEAGCGARSWVGHPGQVRYTVTWPPGPQFWGRLLSREQLHRSWRGAAPGPAHSLGIAAAAF